MKQHMLYRFIVLIVSLFFSAIFFNLFLYPTNLVTGGLNGIAIILTHLIDISPSLVIFMGSIVLLLLSALFLGKEETLASILATFVYPFFVSLTSNIPVYLSIDSGDLILMSILVGILFGLTNGFMYKVGFSNGGLNIISQIFYRYFHLSLSTTTMFLNMVVVLLGGVYFGFSMVLYSLVVIYITKLIMDKVLLGGSKKKAFYILTTKEKELQDYVIRNMKHSVTIFKVKGGFQERKHHMLLAVIPTREYFKVTEGIKMIDKNAFFVVNDAYEVNGGK